MKKTARARRALDELRRLRGRAVAQRLGGDLRGAERAGRATVAADALPTRAPASAAGVAWITSGVIERDYPAIPASVGMVALNGAILTAKLGFR